MEYTDYHYLQNNDLAEENLVVADGKVGSQMTALDQVELNVVGGIANHPPGSGRDLILRERLW